MPLHNLSNNIDQIKVIKVFDNVPATTGMSPPAIIPNMNMP